MSSSRFDSRFGPKPVVSLDRGQLVGVGFFAILSAGLMFALGFAAGRKPLSGATTVAGLRNVDDNHNLHKELSQQPTQVELTFYHSLLEKEDAKRATPPTPPANAVPAPLVVDAPAPAMPAPAPALVEAVPEKVVDKTPEKTLDAVAERASDPPKPEPSLASVKPVPPARGAFTVQVGSFKTDAEARGVVRRLEQRGYDASVLPVSLGMKGTWYRVRVGSYASESDARGMKSRLDRDRFDGWVVKAE